MPRTTAHQYLTARRHVADVVQHDWKRFALLNERDRQYLLDYYEPTRSWSDEQALTHRAQISRQQRNLPQCAGRALRALAGLGRPQPAGRGSKAGDRRVVVRAVRRESELSDESVRRIADALVQFALSEAEAEARRRAL